MWPRLLAGPLQSRLSTAFALHMQLKKYSLATLSRDLNPACFQLLNYFRAWLQFWQIHHCRLRCQEY